MDYSAIQAFEPSRHIYETIRQRSELDSKLIRFNQEYTKLDLTTPATPETKTRSDELLRVSEEYKLSLYKVL